MDDVCGVPRRGGTISRSEQATTAVVAEPVEAARTDVHEPRGAYLDETSGRQGDKRAWVWGAVTRGVTGGVRRSRGGAGARALWGEGWRGLLVTDRYRADHGYPVRWRQLRWAHWWRDVAAMRGRGGVAEEMGTALLEQAHPMLVWWHRVREGTLPRSTLRSSLRPLRREMDRLLEAGRRCGVPPTEGTCRDILQRRQALWTFVQGAGVEPTHNAAERSMRSGVLWRQGSFGTQSEAGSRFVETLMTVGATLKQHKRTVLASLTAAHDAALRGEVAPSLLPAHDMESHWAA